MQIISHNYPLSYINELQMLEYQADQNRNPHLRVSISLIVHFRIFKRSRSQGSAWNAFPHTQSMQVGHFYQVETSRNISGSSFT